MRFYRCQVTNKDVATTKHLNEKTVLCGYFFAVPHLHGEQIGSQLAVFALKLFTNQPLKLLWVASQYCMTFCNFIFIQNTLTNKHAQQLVLKIDSDVKRRAACLKAVMFQFVVQI